MENTPLRTQNSWPHEWDLSCKASGWGPLLKFLGEPREEGGQVIYNDQQLA